MPLPLHMGSLHPYEQALTLLLAFGPFLLLGIVVAVRRRADETDEEQAGQAGQSGQPSGPSEDRPERSGPSQPAR